MFIFQGGGYWLWVVRLQYQRGVWTHHLHYRTVVVVNRWGCVSVGSGCCRMMVGVRYRVVIGHDDHQQVGVRYHIHCQWWWVLAVGCQAAVSEGSVWTHCFHYRMVHQQTCNLSELTYCDLSV